MSWQADTGANEGNPGADGIAPSRPYFRDLKTLADGRYRIIKLAGKGGMSQVFHAYDTQNDRDVAIKVLSLDLVSEETFLARFQRESELMRDLNHPNILRAYDYGQEDDKIYLVMSYYGGGTLKDRLNTGPLELDRIDNYLTQIAAALGYAHSRNIVHRDIKPSNVLIHHAGNDLVLSDFGIAKALSNSNPSRTGTIMGTPLYMAPEQFLDRVDPRSDIYSLGIVLYQMLSGEVPFKGDGIGFKHLYDQMPPLKTWDLNYDPTIENVVVKALAKRPEARFQNVGDMALAFREAVQNFARRDTLNSFRGVNVTGENPTWNSLDADPAVLPGQASLSELPVITPSQLLTEPPVNTSYLAQTTPLSLGELHRFEAENEPLPFHSLPRSFSALNQPTAFHSSVKHSETSELTGEQRASRSGLNSRAYSPIQPQGERVEVKKALAHPGQNLVLKAKKPVSNGTIRPALSGGKARPVTAPTPAKKSGLGWWLLIFPLILAALLAVLVFYLLNGPAQGNNIVPGATNSITASSVVTTAPANTPVATTALVTTAPGVLPGPASPAPTASP